MVKYVKVREWSEDEIGAMQSTLAHDSFRQCTFRPSADSNDRDILAENVQTELPDLPLLACRWAKQRVCQSKTKIGGSDAEHF